MSKGKAICQEFCDEVELFSPIGEKEEIKCQLNLEYFTPLVERMVQGGYCCTQVQRDLNRKTCIAWFEPQMEDGCTLF